MQIEKWSSLAGTKGSQRKTAASSSDVPDLFILIVLIQIRYLSVVPRA